MVILVPLTNGTLNNHNTGIKIGRRAGFVSGPLFGMHYSVLPNFHIFISMSKHTDKINAMKSAGKTLNDEWAKSKITPEKNEEKMKEKIGEIITKNRKKGFSFFR